MTTGRAPDDVAHAEPAYADLAQVYEWLVPDNLLDPRDCASAFAAAVELIPTGGRVMDCASGGGHLAVGLARRGFTVAATDASPAMITRTRQLAADHDVSLTTAVRTWDELPAPQAAGPFDAVFCVGNSISHAAGRQPRRTALASMTRLLATDGVFAVAARDWQQVRAGGDRVEVHDRLVRRRGRAGVVVRAWSVGATWDDAHHLDLAVALLADDDTVTTYRERLTLWAFSHDQLVADLDAVGLDIVCSTRFLGPGEYLIVARRR
ncbi:MAG: class I SAM-dependent methyltransferase [Kineosporiaceae bacterium]|jgi:SAM-dependent methyltransferase